MEIVAITFLIILFLVLQHLMNYISRIISNTYDEDVANGGLIAMVFLIIISVFVAKYIILWTYPLIT